ncbi:MAG TPA: MOSC N-terminal beta barrel domain-containing protein [Steroidobacteraceae bacterium]|jgi:hypothetical protein
MHATIAALHCYPLKSGRGLDLSEAQLTPAGIAHDRGWMVVTSEGRFLTQRELPRLAVIRPLLTASELTLSAPAVAPLRVPLELPRRRVRVQIWNDECSAFEEGDAAAHWLQQVLERDCRLVRFDPQHRRLSSRSWTGALEAQTRFPDAFPLLVIARASLDELNSRLAKPLPMNRFRPNIVLQGIGPYDEDRIDELYGDGIRLRLVKPCVRCRIPTTDQDTGELDGEEPLRTLRSYRFDRELHGVLFGQNTVIVEGLNALLRCGQALQVRWRQTQPPAIG